MMKKLAKVGFQQSPTPTSPGATRKPELTDLCRRSCAGEMGEYYRPNFFANTPDINPFYLQTSGRPGFVVRATLAATLHRAPRASISASSSARRRRCRAARSISTPRNTRSRPGTTIQPGNIRAHIDSAEQRIRRGQPGAAWDFRNTSFIGAWNDNIIAYFRQRLPEARNSVLVLVNLDPHHLAGSYLRGAAVAVRPAR